ncbi:MAG: hypothetical protein ACOVP4_04810 [Bacteriovoracaceae bacterium]
MLELREIILKQRFYVAPFYKIHSSYFSDGFVTTELSPFGG